ncbi:toll/interleukin-1 receptor domain-containing protein [Celeribacter sp.]|uniref:toll/interleukin-1 receptor domain-containing protein n=1 Tax=Celeribacter sp. TaxID=1890673 RepID=UPI003A933D60
MADIFISYTKKNKDTARNLFQALSAQWDVWWDDTLVGDYVEEIEAELKAAQCLIPIWSNDSRDSKNVRDEVRIAERQNIPIIPIKIDDCEPPYGFGGYSGVELIDWGGENDHPSLVQLKRKISQIIPVRQKPVRKASLSSLDLSFPALFMSVSSHETRLPPLDAVRALRLYRAKSILVSAYDLHPKRRPPEILNELEQYRTNGGIVLIDSGNYEAYRTGDNRWQPQSFWKSIKDVPFDMVFSFDQMSLPISVNKSIEKIVLGATRDQIHLQREILPIIHAPISGKKQQVRYDLLPEIIQGVSKELQPSLIAVPERELGPGLVARAKTVFRIRQALNELPYYQPIHLLGTGNPWSLAIFTLAGADSFDGLEWCRIVVDRQTGKLHHYQHLDFFMYQMAASSSELVRVIHQDTKIDYAGKAAFHNLDYFSEFAEELRMKRVDQLIPSLMGKDNFDQLNEQFPELFS